jgi:hypothetical protein
VTKDTGSRSTPILKLLEDWINISCDGLTAIPIMRTKVTLLCAANCNTLGDARECQAGHIKFTRAREEPSE